MGTHVTRRDHRTGRRLSMVLALLVAFGGLACARPSEDQPASTTRRIVDSLDREVSIPAEVERIVSFNSDLTEVIYALGAADKIIAPGYRVSEDQAWLSETAPELGALSSPHSPAGINEEELASLDPDLIVSALFGEIGAEEVIDVGKRLGIPVVIVSFELFSEYFEDVALLAETLGTEERGAELIARLRQEVARVAERTADLSAADRPHVYHGVGDVYHTLGKGIFEDDQIRIAGGVNVASEVDGFGVEVSVEQLLKWNPEVILILWEAKTGPIFDDPRLSDIRAVKSEEVYRHPEQGWGFATPRAIFAITWLARILHPDLFPEIDVEQEADDFYQDVYGFPYSGPPLAGAD